jgi:acyl dehydratase
MMIKAFGAGYIRGGEISVSFIQRVRPGDSVSTHGKVVSSAVADGVERFECEIWLENQSGEKVTVGTAKASLPASASA